ncbi:MAG: VOC family protein [Raineya sp.]|jgi:predicted enzyme related to lactoylglutathione lyase|nr:VOC family protein [Raineya sp.]
MIRFAHTNIISTNWKKLAEFYIKVFNCKPIFPERDLSGIWLDKATNLHHAHLKGIHLALPGYKENPPTLEIFQYTDTLDNLESSINRKGFSHIAFQVDNFEHVISSLIEHGGTLLGEVITTQIPHVGFITFVYAKDIDGNIVEIQHWEK